MPLQKIPTRAVESSAASQNLNIDANTLFLDATNNRVGIGTTSPSSTLHLSSILPILTLTDTDDTSTSRVYQDNESFVIDVDNANAKASSLFKVNIDNTERIRIDSSGRLLVGTTSTTSSSSQSGEVYSAGAIGFLLTNTTAANFPLSVKNEGASGTRNLINFLEGTGGGTARANISFDGSNNLTFSTGGTARISIPIDAGGIKFPATQAASSDANTLDDYEEGTWTPAMSYQTQGTMSATYANQYGWYTKIGNLVYVRLDLRFTGFTKGTASGYPIITGLPFTPANSGGYGGFQMTVKPYQWTYSTIPQAAGNAGGGAFILLSRLVSNSADVALEDPDADSMLFLSGCYQV